MARRRVLLSEHQHALVEALVRSGRYQNASEVLGEGLRLLEARSRVEDASLGVVNAAARLGCAQVAAGRDPVVAGNQLEDSEGQSGSCAELPGYELDDGPLTATQIRAVRRHAKPTLPKGKVRNSRSLF